MEDIRYNNIKTRYVKDGREKKTRKESKREENKGIPKSTQIVLHFEYLYKWLRLYIVDQSFRNALSSLFAIL